MIAVNTSRALIQDAISLCDEVIQLLETSQKGLQHRYKNAGNNWTDLKYQQLGDIVNECYKTIERTLRELNNCIIPLKELKQSIEDYEGVIITHETAFSRNGFSESIVEYKKVPVNNGSWSGNHGDSIWSPEKNYIPLPKKKSNYNNPNNLTTGEIMKKYNINGIRFSNGWPDFSEVSKGNVEIENFSYDRSKNFSKARLELAKKRGCSPKDVGRWMEENKYTWHECQDRMTLQKVPHEVHANVFHYGGISEINNESEN